MFTVQNLQINRGAITSNSQGKFTTTVHTFKDEASTVATIRAYFPDYLGQGAEQDVIAIGDHMLITGSNTSIFCKITSLAPFTMGADLFAGASGLTVDALIAAVDNNAAHLASDILQMEIADATHAGVLTAGAQTIGGHKTFPDGITAAGSPVVPLTVGATIAATDNQAAVITSSVLHMEIADATHSGIVSEAAQDIGGNKTFHGTIIADTINERTALNGTTINGTNIKGDKITLNNPGVFWDNGASIANTVRFGLDTDDFLSYDKPNDVFSVNIGSTNVFAIDPINSTILTDLGIDRFTLGALHFGTPLGTNLQLVSIHSNVLLGPLRTLSADIIDSASLIPLSIGSTNASAIFLQKPTQVTTGNFFTADSIDSTGTVPLVIGNTNATAITLGENTNVSAGKTFTSNAIDATTAVPLVIGATTATQITLDENTVVSTGKSLTTNAIDATTAVPLVIGSTTATAITLDENTTVSSGKTLATNTLDATTAGALTIGGTTATSVSIDENTTITATHTLSCNNIDAISAVPLVLGTSQASQITLDENTVVSSGKILSTNTLDATSAGTLTIGGTTATAITLDENTTVSSGKTLFTNTLDSTSAGTLTIGGATATAITLDENTTISSGHTLFANTLDAATSGALTIGGSTSTSTTLTDTVNFSVGANFPTSGGTATLLDYYENTTHSTTFTCAGVTSASISLQLTRIGNHIIIRIPALTIAIAGAGTCASNTALPTTYRPPVTYQWPEVVQDVGIAAYGRFQITSGGIINIGTGAGGGNFAIGNSGWPSSIVIAYTNQ